jgi:tRNA pseudouridine32 synthase/23S rRNA pseudouridine746 synthase
MIRIVYEDDDIVAVDKPEGMAAIPERRPDGSSLFETLCAERGERLYIVHRIDKDTSGLIVFARNADTHRRLSRQFETRQVEKVYLALVHGVIAQDSGRIDKPLRQFGSGRVGVDLERGKPSLTEFRVLQQLQPAAVARPSWPCLMCPDQGQDALATPGGVIAPPPAFTLVEARPRTGRRHQIRVHLYSIGHPIIGDPLYGHKAQQQPYRRVMLHAFGLTLDHPPGKRLTLEAAVPRSFRSTLDDSTAS